jgi:hypothetical protein
MRLCLQDRNKRKNISYLRASIADSIHESNMIFDTVQYLKYIRYIVHDVQKIVFPYRQEIGDQHTDGL